VCAKKKLEVFQFYATLARFLLFSRFFSPPLFGSSCFQLDSFFWLFFRLVKQHTNFYSFEWPPNSAPKLDDTRLAADGRAGCLLAFLLSGPQAEEPQMPNENRNGPKWI